MIVHTMTVPQMVVDARKDFPAITNKVGEPYRQLRKEVIRTKEEMQEMLEWISPKGKNHWLLLLHQKKHGTCTYCLTWYYDGDGRINALVLGGAGIVYHIDRHVIERYGDRFDPNAKPLDRLKSFFLHNYFYSVEVTEQKNETDFGISVGMNQGMGLGVWSQGEEIAYVRTFVNHGQLFENQADAMERMDVERMVHTLTPGQRRWFINEFKRRTHLEPGSPALEWLNNLAA